ncbi:MAG TPA: glycosyltransferase family 2 protein [Thermoanaerobaculia bacterium]|jgi:hypothetical protein|nr:glycosyltransferase family 2 protein [Thermoanaerobaculia bacterium]
MTDVPVALFLYNRAELVRASVAALRAVAPRKIFLIADGPRANAEDRGRTETTRAAAESIDWSCDVTKIYADDNLGCSRRIASGITEVLRQSEAAVILEDDCIAEPTFFRFAAELLEKYAADDRVAGVSGDNFHFGRTYGADSYLFSDFPHCWGWATWARAWSSYDREMTGWDAFRSSGWLEREFGAVGARYWRNALDATSRGEIDSWAYRWSYACWRNARLTIIPSVNLVANLGFGATASHTRRRSALERVPAKPMAFPLSHPARVERNVDADRRIEKHVFERPRLLWLDRAASVFR